MPYRILAQTWHDFYIVAGTASATLVGLLFVSLSLHLRAVLTRSEVRGLARATLANFALVLLVALIVVIPQDGPSAGTQLEATGAASALIVMAPAIRAGRSRTRTIRPLLLLMRFALGALGYASTVAAGALLTTGNDRTAFTFLASATIVLLVLSLRNTWDLVVSVGEAIVKLEARDESTAQARR